MASLTKHFLDILDAAELLRRGYRASLGSPVEGALRDAFVASQGTTGSKYEDLLTAIYGQVTGTRRGIVEQRLMDFVPGFYLVHFDELGEAKATVMSVGGARAATYYPFLANYSSDFICVDNSSGKIGLFCHDDPEFNVMHQDAESFFRTVSAWYSEGAFFTDSDGYLDADFALEGSVGEQFNPGIDFWTD